MCGKKSANTRHSIPWCSQTNLTVAQSFPPLHYHQSGTQLIASSPYRIMVWPFSSNSSGGSDASSVVSSAKALFRAAGASVEEATRSIPEHMKPYLITAAAFGVSASAIIFYRGRLCRIPTAAYLTPNLLKGKTVLRGKVTSVGDADNFRFYHTPGGIWAGWGWLRRVPTESKGDLIWASSYLDTVFFSPWNDQKKKKNKKGDEGLLPFS